MTSTEQRIAEREALRAVIQQWNANRLDLFELSEPDEVSISDVNMYTQFTFLIFFSPYHPMLGQNLLINDINFSFESFRICNFMV